MEVTQLLDPSQPAPDDVAVTRYEYDGGGNLTAVIDANGNRTGYVVDDFGQTRRITSPVTGTTDMLYNPAGQLAHRTDSRGVTTTTTYDASGRAVEVVSDDGVTSETLLGAWPNNFCKV